MREISLIDLAIRSTPKIKIKNFIHISGCIRQRRKLLIYDKQATRNEYKRNNYIFNISEVVIVERTHKTNYLPSSVQLNTG